MQFKDLAKETYWALSANKTRSFLTMLGIIIGIASVIAMVSVGQGTQGSIESSIESAGSNLIIVYPGAQRGVGMQVSGGRGNAQTLTMDDADAIETQVDSVAGVAPVVTRRYQVVAVGTNTNTQVIGTVPEYSDVRSTQIETGNFITEQSLESASRIAVLGATTKEDLFGTDVDPIGEKIRINQIEFKIVGVMEAKGGSGMSSTDDAIYIPLTTAQRYLSGDTYVSTIYISSVDQNSMQSVQDQTTSLLLERHNITDAASADFSVSNQNDIVETASTITDTFTVLLACIAGISLVVGGIGIMNMMLTTVTERTREIGLRKAIGAKRKDIVFQFLFESIALTFFGGIAGVALGWIASLLIATFAGISTEITVSSVALSVGVSTIIGVAFGYYPAYRAARLNPIEALRYE